MSDPGLVHRTTVSGIPVFWAERPGPLSCELLFRVGQADESLHRRGTTHLIEHLVLSSSDLPILDHNGSVGPTITTFTASGTPDEIADFLHRVANALTALPVDRLDNEVRVLRTEAQRRAGSPYGRALVARYGAQGYGLPGCPELGLRDAAPDALREWADHWFTRGNATLWLSGPPPAGLELGMLPDGLRRAAPVPAPLAAQPFPCRLGGPDDQVLALMPLQAGPPAELAISVAGLRLHRRLRRDEGRSYSVGGEIDALTARDVHGVLFADCQPDEAADTLAAFRVELTKLGLHGPSRDEIDEARTAMRPPADTAEAGTLDARRRARDELLGGAHGTGAPPRREALDALDGATLAAVLKEALGQATWVTPGFADFRDHRIHPVATASVPTLTGTTLRRPIPVGPHHPDRLVVGDEGMSLCWPDDEAITVRWDEVAAVQHWDDDARTVWSVHGRAVAVRAGEWVRGEQALAEIDRRLGPLEVPERAPLGPAYLDPLPATGTNRGFGGGAPRPPRAGDRPPRPPTKGGGLGPTRRPAARPTRLLVVAVLVAIVFSALPGSQLRFAGWGFVIGAFVWAAVRRRR